MHLTPVAGNSTAFVGTAVLGVAGGPQSLTTVAELHWHDQAREQPPVSIEATVIAAMLVFYCVLDLWRRRGLLRADDRRE